MSIVRDHDAQIIRNIRSKALESQFKDVQYYSFNDVQGGQYGSNVINYNTSQLQSNTRGVVLSEACLVIPDKISVTHYGATQNAPYAYSLGIKNGHQFVIDSLIASINNVNLVQNTKNECMLMHAKMMCLRDQQSVDTMGDMLGFIPDSSSCAYSSTAGEWNNNIGGTGQMVLSGATVTGLTAGSPFQVSNKKYYL